MSTQKRILDADVIKLNTNLDGATIPGTITFNGTNIVVTTPITVTTLKATSNAQITGSLSIYGASGSANNGVVLTDAATGTHYKLFVYTGSICIVAV